MFGLSNDILKLNAWQKANSVPGYDPNMIRQDKFGSYIKYDEYGKTSDLGLEIDHIIPKSLFGPDVPMNHQALHWRNNRVKSNKLIG